MANQFESLRQLVGDKLRQNESMHRHTVARLGGPADALVVADTLVVLEQVVRLAWAQGWAMRILGGGSNVLIGDRGVRGLVVINDAKAVDYRNDGHVIAESGAVITHVARNSIAKGLAGFEWAISVPGTVGGAAVNNAGAHGGDMAHQVIGVEIAFKDKPNEYWSLDKLDYRYRESALKHSTTPFVVLTVEMQLQAGHDPAVLGARADAFIAQRKRTQPSGASLGSMFKNPPGDFAGRLIEAAGLKGTRHGGVMISPKHGNFFINVEQGTAADYLSLIRMVQDQVLAKFGVELELEVELVGEFA